MNTEEIDNFWAQPDLNFQKAFPELEKSYSEYLTDRALFQNQQQVKELLRELMIRLSAVTQKFYLEELQKLSENIKSMGFAEGAKYLKALLEKGSKVQNIIESLEKKPEEEKFFLQQLLRADGIAASISVSQLSNAKPSSTASGCYLATMAYGSYEHPQVINLRNFRDNILSKSKFGLCFIKKYYQYSPKMVQHLKDKKLINNIIRKSLDIFIKLIS
jgi:hypothetical protein